jgi:bacteriocin-like protein
MRELTINELESVSGGAKTVVHVVKCPCCGGILVTYCDGSQECYPPGT